MPIHPQLPLATPNSTVGHLARLQQAVTLGACLAALAVGWLVWPYSPGVAVALAFGVLFGYAAVMALEFLIVAFIHRDDPAPRASGRELLIAWCGEVTQGLRVFAWRQPFASRCLPDTATGAAGDGHGAPHAVVFIHGFVCNRGFWLPWMKRLRALGVPYASMNLEPVFGSIDHALHQVEHAVQRAIAATGRPPLLVCHSMGGLVARAWLASDPANAQRVLRIVTIGSPHRGTWLARFSHLPNGRQMRQGADWLTALAVREHSGANAAPYRLFTCWYSNADNIVFPASTATLAGADNRLVRGCAHVALAFHPKVMSESLGMVASGASSPIERTAS